jgi:hypothetical protein
MTEFEASVPVYYIVKRSLNDKEVVLINGVLEITPIYAAIIVDAHDWELANRLSNEVIYQSTMERALTLAKDLDYPSIVLGDAEFLDAVYEDGFREAVNIHVDTAG